MLSHDDKAAVERVKSLVDVSHDYLEHDFNVWRWIVAYRGDEAEAARVLRRHLNIRHIMSLEELADAPDNDRQATEFAPISLLGKNHPEDNKVLLFELSGRTDIHGLVDNLVVSPFMRARFALLERIHRRVVVAEKESGRQSAAVLVMDLEGLRTPTPSFLSILAGPYRIMWGTLFEQFPQLIQQIIVINAPKFANLLYATCSPFIPDDYRQRVFISSDTRALLDHVHPSCLPRHYGGSLEPRDDDLFHPIRVPLSSVPSREDPQVSLETFSVPAGGKYTIIFYWTAETQLEFFMRHSNDLHFFIYFSAHTEAAEDADLREIYAGCERPAVRVLDHWTWKTPHTGFYHLQVSSPSRSRSQFSNERAWFFSANVEYRIFALQDGVSWQEEKAICERDS